MDNLLTGSVDNIAHIRDARFLVRQARRHRLHRRRRARSTTCCTSRARPRRIDYRELPIQTLKVGALGTHKALGLAKARGAKFLLASTSEVYGDPLVHPQHEEYWGNVNPVGPRGVYDEAKRFAEAMTMAYHRVHGVDTRIVRIFNTYGPRMRLNDGRAIPTFIRQALDGEPLTVFGDGSPDALVHRTSPTSSTAIWKLMNAPVNDPVNLGNPQRADAARARQASICASAGSKSEIVFRPLPDGRPQGAPARHQAGAPLLGLGAARGRRGGAAADARVVSEAGRA